MAHWPPIEGQTPIDDISGLKAPGIRTRAELSDCEFENVVEATSRYLSARPTPKLAPFTLTWCYQLHHEMFGKIWEWAGTPRRSQTNFGIPPHQIDTRYWQPSSPFA